VYLIHHDQPVWCASAARSVLASEGVEVDLTIIDNGQHGGEQLAALLPPDVRILPMASNRGYTGAANAALVDWLGGSGQLTVIGSHDLHVESDTFLRLLTLAADRPEAGIIAPALVAPEPAAGGIWKGREPRQYPPDGVTDLVEAQWASGTCLLLRRACVESVGPFDERLGSYVEDVDYGLRATDRGWKVLVLVSAHAWGLGSGSVQWGWRSANVVLVNAKRSGWRGALLSLSDASRSTARGLLASVLPWRDRAQRRNSWSRAKPRSVALLRLVLSGRLVATLRHPADPTWGPTRGRRSP
jgi:N-acetylglucosaminyl-diphospho-decaprenol L-rhamnosyltransferase